MNERIREVFSDAEYIKCLLAMDSYEDIQSSLEENDIDLSIEEIDSIHELLSGRPYGELNDNELENVTGGCISEVLYIAKMASTVRESAVRDVIVTVDDEM